MASDNLLTERWAAEYYESIAELAARRVAPELFPGRHLRDMHDGVPVDAKTHRRFAALARSPHVAFWAVRLS